MPDPMTAAQWSAYYDAMEGALPHATLLFALSRFAAEETPARENDAPFAIDLGCGEGRGTVELLRQGWRVLALDGQEEGIRRLRTRPDLPPGARLEARAVRYEDLHLPGGPADLVNASYSLPFCAPEHFSALWQQVVGAVAPGGRFAGQLFGDRDTWATRPGMTHHTRADAERLLAPFILERFDEEECDGRAVSGPKHWHVFHIVARKP